MTVRCQACGCTDERACPGGCSWVAPGQCSACFYPSGDPIPFRAADVGEQQELTFSELFPGTIFMTEPGGPPAPARITNVVEGSTFELHMSRGQLDLGVIYDLPRWWHPIARRRKRRAVWEMIRPRQTWDQAHPMDDD